MNHLGTLRRRVEYLADAIATGRGNPSALEFYAKEREALLWAIGLVAEPQAEVRRLAQERVTYHRMAEERAVTAAARLYNVALAADPDRAAVVLDLLGPKDANRVAKRAEQMRYGAVVPAADPCLRP